MTPFSVARYILSQIQAGKLDATNVVNIIQAVTRYVRGDVEAVMEVMALIAKGPDELLGTADDIAFPEATVQTVQMLLTTPVVQQLAATFAPKCGCLRL